jgi:predicted kinase
MKHLILLRGAPGSGKSTFVSQQNLTPYTICPDEIRLSIGGIVLTDEGREMIDQSHETEVWQEVARLTEDRMQRGELIVIDATFQQTQDFAFFIQIAAQYTYTIYCIDFTHVSQAQAIAQNVMREPYKQVPEFVIQRAYERFQNHPLPAGITVLSAEEAQGIARASAR